MVFDVLADAVVVVHLAFIVFVAVGALLACRWRWLVWLHLPAVAWGAGIVAIGWDCPLTPLEQWLRRRAGESFEEGFVDHYLEDVVYPEQLTPVLRALAAVLIAAGYALLVVRGRQRRARSRRGAATTRPAGGRVARPSPSGTGMGAVDPSRPDAEDDLQDVRWVAAPARPRPGSPRLPPGA